MWISRDKDGFLQMGNIIPMKGRNEFHYSQSSTVNILDEDLFNEVTFENSPVEIKLLITNKQ